ncbi:catechol 1,2-dioxygenase [uncultured Nocardioides sp.]|jgi:catechol 1,2-dioxygenase|uniref:catechol 1,2-dioxygenase n=1 Tax=uncultured Nocardioides sp. TaxID=198441 RepID=UPI000C3FD532|nr:catechol 1,2-dioxygenase [Nocardioides sp.]|tara:strand:- start:463 stop:1338 length:876 start_codon:yes stop_codon:yes gene_type:complete
MTLLDQTLEDTRATAAATGASATERFRADKASLADTPPERVSTLAREVLEAVHATIRRHDVTYDEFNALKAWLISVGEDGEWPLFLDVWVEHVVEEVNSAQRAGSKGTIEGPFYVPGAPRGTGSTTLSMRADEPGTPLLFTGTVTSVDGTPLPGALVEIWHADADGFYSQFAPDIPEWNLRGAVVADEDGSFSIRTVQPAPYQIPTDGSCGKLIHAAGWHSWRPAHLHLKVGAEGHQLVTTQLYFPGDPHNDDDVASAVKPELMLDPRPAEDGDGAEVVYDFVLDRATTEG